MKQLAFTLRISDALPTCQWTDSYCFT